MATVQDICTRAALNLGAVQNGEAPTSAELTVIQSALNALLDSESIQRDSIFRVKRDRYALIANTQNYSLGTGSTDTALSAVRPDYIESISIAVSGSGVNEQTIQLRLIEDEDWQLNTMRNYAADWPNGYHVEYTSTYLTLSFYPVPTRVRSIDVFTDEALARTVNLSDDLILPKGYERFLVSNLALEIQPVFPGTQLSPQLLKIADDSRNAVRNYNRKQPPRLYSTSQLRDDVTRVRVDSMRS